MSANVIGQEMLNILRLIDMGLRQTPLGEVRPTYAAQNKLNVIAEASEAPPTGPLNIQKEQ